MICCLVTYTHNVYVQVPLQIDIGFVIAPKNGVFLKAVSRTPGM